MSLEWEIRKYCLMIEEVYPLKKNFTWGINLCPTKSQNKTKNSLRKPYDLGALFGELKATTFISSITSTVNKDACSGVSLRKKERV